jgi:hypothetical protein
MSKSWLCVDPGETTGYSVWDADGALLWADQMPMWKFADAVYSWAQHSIWPKELGGDDDEGNPNVLNAIICEQWQLYPWELENLAWDECRTARVIGALTLITRQFGIQLHIQGADIKEGAVQAGAESLFLEPVHENRHANDSIMHGVFYKAVNGGPPK